MNATSTQKKKTAGSTAFTIASVKAGTFGDEHTAIWLKSCDSPARFYLDRLEGKPLHHSVAIASSKVNNTAKHTPGRLRRMQKPRGIKSAFTDCIRWLLSWRLIGPIFAF